MSFTTLGLDLGKSIFHSVIINTNNQVTAQGKSKQNQLLDKLSKLKVGRVTIEACASSHYSGQQQQELDHVVVLIPPHKVKPYVQGQRNDMNDALTIAEAAQRPESNTVPVKTLLMTFRCWCQPSSRNA